MTINIPYRMGANIREIAYYGVPDTMFQGVDPNVARHQIQVMSEVGVQLLRFYAPHHRVSTERSLELTGRILDILAEFNMQAVVCLGDGLSHSGHFFLKDGDFHTEPHNGHLHRRYWIEEHWRNNYLPYVKEIVERFKDHDAVLIWELGNEHSVLPQDGSEDVAKGSKGFLNYVRTTTETIRAIDPSAIVGTGLVNSRHVFTTDDPAQLKAFSRELHSIVDAVSLHVYELDAAFEDPRLEIDAAVAREMGKLLYIGEIGSNFDDLRRPRPDYYRDQFKRWRDRGAFSVMVWSFNGTNDKLADSLGVSRHLNDYDKLVHLMVENKGDTQKFIRKDVKRAEPKPKVTFDPNKRYFQASINLSIRSEPKLGDNRVQKNGANVLINQGEIVAMDAASRTEADGYVWWKHSCGWSAEKSLDGENTYLTAVVADDNTVIAQPDC